MRWEIKEVDGYWLIYERYDIYGRPWLNQVVHKIVSMSFGTRIEMSKAPRIGAVIAFSMERGTIDAVCLIHTKYGFTGVCDGDERAVAVIAKTYGLRSILSPRVYAGFKVYREYVSRRGVRYFIYHVY